MHRPSWRQILVSGVIAVSLLSGFDEALASQAEFAAGPDANQALLFKSFRSAKQKIQINAYDFSYTPIADALIARIRAGVTVELLVETQPFKLPVRSMSADAKKLLTQVFNEMKSSGNPDHRVYLMGNNLYWENGQPLKVKRRFNFDHAKYVIIDGRSLLVSSDNFTSTGHTDPGKKGNRGWDILIDDAATVADFSALFRDDASTAQKDVLAIDMNGRLPGFITKIPETSGEQGEQGDQEGRDTAVKSQVAVDRPVEVGVESGDVKSVEVVTSPRSMPGLTHYMKAAQKSLDLEFMSLPMNWYAGPKASPSPFIQNLIDLALDGIEVRALLNDDKVFSDPGEDKDSPNELTVDYLNDLAKCHKLPLSAKIVDTKAVNITYIHNKGMIVDGVRVLVNSINGTKNSVQSNRETAVVVDSPAAGRYFSSVFSSDWEKSPLTHVTSQTSQCPDLPTQQRVGISFATPWTRTF